jgi:hypothetical protein
MKEESPRIYRVRWVPSVSVASPVPTAEDSLPLDTSNLEYVVWGILVKPEATEPRYPAMSAHHLSHSKVDLKF